MRTSNNVTARVLLVLAWMLAGCSDDRKLEIVPDHFETVTMHSVNRRDLGEHEVSILVPAGYKLGRHAGFHERWDRGSDPELWLYYSPAPFDESIEVNFQEARNPCHYPYQPKSREMFRRTHPDGFQVLCAHGSGVSARPTVVKRFIRVDDALLNCTLGVADAAPDAIRGAWNVCASVVVRAPRTLVLIPNAPPYRWSMELVTFDDGWTGWKTHRHPSP